MHTLISNLSIHCHNNRAFMAKYRPTKPWGKMATRVGVLSQSVVGVSPRGSFCRFEQDTNIGTYQWNKFNIILGETISSNVRPLQIPLSATQNQIIGLEVWP